jgi:hypothetical protein
LLLIRNELLLFITQVCGSVELINSCFYFSQHIFKTRRQAMIGMCPPI